MLVVNLFGAPGAGKSTGAAYIFSKLKLAGISAELITEFAKDKVYEETKEIWNNQVYIFGKQYFRLSRVKDKVDVVVTDAPIFLSTYYNNDPILGKAFDDVCLNIHFSFDNLNVFVHRAKPYNPKGRFQTEAESDQVAVELEHYLVKNAIEYLEIQGTIEDYDKLADLIVEKIK